MLHEMTQALPKPSRKRTFSRKMHIMKTLFRNEISVATRRAGAVVRTRPHKRGPWLRGFQGPVPYSTAHPHSQGSLQGSPQKIREQNLFALVSMLEFRERGLTYT